MSLLTNTYDVHKGEFETAGDASASIKRKLKQLGVDSAILRRVAVASYEAELNLIIHSLGAHHGDESGAHRADLQGCGPRHRGY